MKRLMSYVSFTKNEAKVILFVISVLTAGLVIKHFNFITQSSYVKDDFTEYDRKFIERSLTGEEEADSNFRNNSELRKKIDEMQNEESTSQMNNSSNGNHFDRLQSEIIDLNTATPEMLVELPGIGESTAAKIIEYRNRAGKFRSTNELMNIKGIGKKKFESIKDYIKAD